MKGHKSIRKVQVYIMLNIVDKLNEWIEPFKNFVMKYHDNPMMWLAFVLIGIFAFSVVFGALHRNGEQ